MRMTQLMRDKLVLLKADGTRVLDIKGNVQKGKILIMRGDISIEPGDEIHREMPGGKFEEYVVVEPNFRQGLHGFSAHYQTEVRRKEYQPLSAATTSATHTTNYNFYGANSRVNNASIDYSTNFSGSDENVRLAMDLIKSARTDLESAKMEPADLQTTATTLDIVESQVQAEAPSKPIIKTLLAGLPVVAQALPSIVKLIEMFQS